MRNITTLLIMVFFATTSSFAQVKIGDNPQNINPASVLELESTDKVLVITRVTTIQMNAITPSPGALCYNTDLQSVHYYNGTQWVNLGVSGGTGGPLTAQAIVNAQPTIVITPTATGDNLEVAPNSIRTEQIVDGGVNGIDIQDGSIGPGKLQNNSVTEEKLSENSVGTFALDNDNIGVSAFNNDAGYITAADIGGVSADANNSLEDRPDGAYYSDQLLVTAINQNTNAIALDTDQSSTNERQNLIYNATTNVLTITTPATAGNQVDLSGLAGGGGTDDQDLSLTGNVIGIEDGNTIDLTPILGTGGTDDQDLSLTGNVIGIEDGNTIDLTPILGAGGTDDQNLETPILSAANVLTLNIEGGDPTSIDLSPLAGAGGTDDQNLETPTLSAANVLTLNIEGGDPTSIDLSPLAGAGGTDDQNLGEVLAEGNDGGAALIKNILDPVDNQDAATKAYVDAAVTSGGSLTDGTILVGGAGDVAQQLVLNGDATLSNTAELTIADNAITLAKIDQNGASADGDILKWNMALDGGAGGWEVGVNAGHTGTAKSIFYADTDGTPTTAFNVNEGDINSAPSLVWDPTKRFNSGQLQIGLDGKAAPGDVSKVVIAETPSGGADVMFPLLVQTLAPGSANASTGILFSPETHGPATLAKGALIYQRTGDWAVGDFHFLQNDQNIGSAQGETKPTIADKAFTIRNNSDIVLYGGIEIDGIGKGTAGQVLASTGNTAADGVEWVDNGGSSVTDADANDGLSTYVATTGYNINVDDTTIELNTDALRIKPATIDPVTPVDQILVTDETSGNVEWQNFPAGSTPPTDADANDGLSTYAAATGYNINVDDTTIELNTDALRIKPATIDPVTPVDQILVTDETSGNVEWQNFPAGSTPPTDADGNDGLSTYAAATGYNINVDDTTIELNTDALRIKPATIDPVTPVDQVLVTDETSGNVEWQDFPTGNQNLSTTDLVQPAASVLRTYELTNANQSLVFTGAGNVGIGNGANPPANKLHVGGAIRSEGILNSDGTASIPAYRFSGDTNTGMFWSAADELGFSAGGQTVLSMKQTAANGLEAVSNGSLELTEQLLDKDGEAGTAGQILSSTATATDWIDAPQGVASKARVAAATGTNGGYTIPVTGQTTANYIINVSVFQNTPGNAIMIQIVNQTATDFSVQIFEFIGGVPAPTNADWNYTIYNP